MQGLLKKCILSQTFSSLLHSEWKFFPYNCNFVTNINDWKYAFRFSFLVVLVIFFTCWLILKLVSAIFHFFTKWQPLNNYEKCIVFRLPLFSPVGHCLWGWSKINHEDVINCYNKNLTTHFVGDLEKEKMVWHWNFVNWHSIT